MAGHSISLTDTPLDRLETDAIVIGISSGKSDDRPHIELGPGAATIDKALDGRLADALTRLGATGSVGDVTKLATFGATKTPMVVAVGLGKFDEPLLPESVRKAAGAAIRALTGTKRVTLALAIDDPTLVRPAAEGAALGAYDFTSFKSTLGAGYRPPVRTISLAVPEDVQKTARAECKRASVVAEAVARARDWINTPANALRPPEFADSGAEYARAAGLEVSVLDEKALRKAGFGGIVAVGSGSDAGPRLVRVDYRAPKTAKARIAIVGKGITFDSGGLSIKPAQGMNDMKSDMSGAAVVLAAIVAIAKLKLPVDVTAYAPMAENMPSGSAYRPGDVITLYGGNRVEILNTDAEGRIVLGDALARAGEDQPDYLIDVATLTGGQVTALGHRIAGVMGTPELCSRVQAAGERTGEGMWPMPMPEEVRSGMDSAIADYTQINSSWDRGAHMLQGAAFLAESVPAGVKWAHIDIAGPAYNRGGAYGYIPKGATGIPLRTVVEIVDDIAEHG